MKPGRFSIFDKMIEGVQVINRDWQYFYVNDTVVEHGKYLREELLGHTMMERYPGIEETGMFRYLELCMHDREPHQMVNEFDFPDGSKGYFELRMQPVEEGVLIFSFDVTKQKLAEQVLQNNYVMLEEMVNQRTAELTIKNRDLEQFAYIASHDLQEPIRTISNYISLFEEDYREALDPAAMAYLQSMEKATRRMGVLAHSLLDYARLGRDKKLGSVNCTDLVAEVMNDLEHMITSSGAVITVGEMPTLFAYEIEMRQLVQNLLTNAIKFRRKDVTPEISIIAVDEEGKWKFTVTDNGIGIDPRYAGRIFAIFQRLHSRDEYEGSGIGLANCKKIVELHGGEISVSPNEAGPGTTFTFTLSTHHS